MAIEHGAERLFKVYRLLRSGSSLRFKNIYSLEQVVSFNGRAEAESWITESGKKKMEYTILEVIINH